MLILNPFNTSCLFSDGITISSTFLQLSSGTGFSFTFFFQQFFFQSILLWVQLFYGLLFWKNFFAAISRTFLAVSNRFFSYLVDIYLVNDKNLCHLIHFFFLVLLQGNVSRFFFFFFFFLLIFSVCNGLQIQSVNAMIIFSNSVLWVFKNTKLLGSTFSR